MATVDVFDWEKKKVGTVDLDDSVFATEVRKDILHQIVRWQLAKRRSGTHKAKRRGDVSGGGKKPYRQKGTGNARRGSTRSPLIRGGGVIHGPEPRNYDFSVNKKVKALGLKSALSYLQAEGRLFVVDSMDSAEGKTKEAAQKLKNFGLSKAFLVDAEEKDLFGRSTQNLKTFKYGSVNALNVYDLLKLDNLVLTKAGVEVVQSRLGAEK